MQTYNISSITTFFSKKATPIIDQHEIDLVKRCQNRDMQAMEEIVRQYENQVYNIAYGMLGSPEDAQDITQDVFVSVWEKIGQFRFRSKFSTWLYRIAKNMSLNEKSRRTSRKTDVVEIDDSQAWVPVDYQTPEDEILASEQQQILHKALGQLKESYRTILVLREMEELSYEDLSAVLGCSIGRVKSRLYEARMQLRGILKREN
ncbi:MAG: sigma-70 family RNA polymerase sigma factor [Candidatus Poribacteria bacterium]|nr:sigma-70 family RNA polymerase sigma factor [Candidatus Poribacteria bacterium]